MDKELRRAQNGKPQRTCYNKYGMLSRNWSLRWLKKYFHLIEIGVREFCHTVCEIMDRKIIKVYTLVLYGPTNAAKSLLCRLMTEFLENDIILRRAENSAFAYENLLDRTVGLMEEPRTQSVGLMEKPRITAQTVVDIKQLFGGE